jgi:integrase/recombinase XerD
VRYAINNQVVLSRPPEGPLAGHIVAFAQAMSERGYGLWSLKYQVRIAACFCRWLVQKKIAVRRISSEHPALYLRYRYRHQRPHREDSAALRHLVEFLRLEGVIPREKRSARRLTSVERRAQAYEKYLREARALAKATITNYLPFICDFLKDRFGDGPVTLSRLCADDVVRFVQRQVPRLNLKRAKLMTTALRSFLRYARYCGDITLDLAAAVPVVANWSMTSIPRAISVEQVRQLLGSVDRHTVIGRRDYAILLLLAGLGLRSGEVASLELDDIDWNAGQFSVRGKGGQRNDLPLTAEVGKAIAAYLRQGRPQSTSRRVFLRAKAPIRGLIGASGCSDSRMG